MSNNDSTNGNLGYFAAIEKRVQELNELALEYLSKFPERSANEVIDEIYQRAWELFEEADDDFDRLPKDLSDEISMIVEGSMPYLPPTRTSLYRHMAYSSIAAEAHLVNLRQRLYGQETEKLPFECVADQSIVEQYCGLAESKPESKSTKTKRRRRTL